MTRRDYLDQIAAVVKQDIVDIMLTSLSNMEVLHEDGVYTASAVKPAVRADDTTDCWGGIRGLASPWSRHERPGRAIWGRPRDRSHPQGCDAAAPPSPRSGGSR